MELMGMIAFATSLCINYLGEDLMCIESPVW